MADDVLLLPDDSDQLGKKLDTESLSVGANTVHRERHQITGELAAEIAAVLNADPGSSVYALVTREVARGSSTSAASIPVVIASDQGDVSIDDGGNSITVDDGGTTISVDDGAGSLTVDGTVTAAQATAASLNAQVQGNVAADTADAGNPIKIGGRAVEFGDDPNSYEDGDRADSIFNRDGVMFVLGGHPNMIARRDNYTGAQTDTAIVTVGASDSIVVTGLSVLAHNANSVDVTVRIGFGTTTTPVNTSVVLAHPGIAPGSGVVEGTGTAVLGFGSGGQDLRITSTVPTGGSIDVLVKYFIISI